MEKQAKQKPRRHQTWRASAQQIVHRVARRMQRRAPKPHAVGAPDFGSVLSIASLVVVVSVLSHAASPSPPKEEALDVPDEAQHLFAETPPKEPAETKPDAQCVGSVEPVVRTQTCSRTEFATWRWAAPNVLRQAMGAKPCWWHAEVTDLAAISGITESYAERAIAARDALTEQGERTTQRLPQELDELLGAHRMRVLVEGVSLDCAMTPRRETHMER